MYAAHTKGGVHPPKECLAMNAVLLAFAVALAPNPSSVLRATPEVHFEDYAGMILDAEYDKRKNEAGKDLAKLWKLYEWCVAEKRDKEAKSTLKAILKIDANHKEANVASGHVFLDGKWFTSQKKADEYQKAKEEEEKKAQGLVSYKGEWVPADDVPFLERGLVKDDRGNWISADEAKKLAEGWSRQDLEWIDPKEASKVAAGLWKCGSEWLPLDKADEYHNDIGDWWRIPGDNFTFYSTIARGTLTTAVAETAGHAYADLEGIFGMKPQLAPIVVLLRDAEQYGAYAAGSEEDERFPTEIDGLSSIHHAYYAEIAFETTGDPRSTYLGAGVGYWDAAAKDGDKWGVHSVRHAAAQSWLEAIDPSMKWLDKLRKDGKVDPRGFWEEKRLPRWYRYGAASYAERYFSDPTVKTGGDKQWARKWSVSNITAKGGLRQLKQVFEFKLDSSMGGDGAKLMNEAGLLVAFLQDGGCEPVQQKNKAFLEAFRAGKDKKTLDPLVRALETEISKHEAMLKAWAGL